MSLKEKFEQLQREGMGLSQRLVERKKLERLKSHFASEPFDFEKDVRESTRERLIESGLIDLFIEAINYVPDPTLVIQYPPKEGSDEVSISIRWDDSQDDKEKRWREFGVLLSVGDDIVRVYSAFYQTPTWLFTGIEYHTGSKEFFNKSLTSDEWGDSEMLESVIADALWRAEIRIPGSAHNYE